MCYGSISSKANRIVGEAVGDQEGVCGEGTSAEIWEDLGPDYVIRRLHLMDRTEATMNKYSTDDHRRKSARRPDEQYV